MSRTEIGVIGLGRMGSNIATRLHESGFRVTGYDEQSETQARLVDEGIEGGESPASVAEASDLVLSSLPTPEIVENVYLGTEGIDAGARRGEDVIALEMSSITPGVTRSIAGESDAVDLLDAPVSGGPGDCKDGSLVAIIGGDEDVLKSDEVQTIMNCLTEQTFYAGAVGAGHTVKLLNNVMSMGNLLLAMEVVSLGTAAGVDGEVLNEILTNTGGSSNQLKKRLPRVLNRNFEPGFTVEYARKDTGLALEMGDDQNVPLVLSGLINQLYTRASAEGFGNEDCCSVVKLFEQSMGEAVEASAPVDESFDGYR